MTTNDSGDDAIGGKTVVLTWSFPNIVFITSWSDKHKNYFICKGTHRSNDSNITTHKILPLSVKLFPLRAESEPNVN